ncbi:MAG: hypothetical protein R6U96_12565 [Promethearchaeia archaeon]
MTDIHIKTFFGQNTGLMIKSNSRAEPFIHLICFRKKVDGTWEKPSKGAGKIIKCSLEEIALILEVLNKKRYHWQNYHNYKDTKTLISFEWEDDKFSNLWIKIGEYRRYLKLGEITVMYLFLAHLLEEKIIYATIPPIKNKSSPINDQDFPRESSKIGDSFKLPHHVKNDPFLINNKFNQSSNRQQKEDLYKNLTNIGGTIKKGTKKALLITFSEGNEIWIPKSTIHNNYILQKRKPQEFLIDNWVLERNNLLEK